MKRKNYESPVSIIVTLNQRATICVGSPNCIDEMTEKYDWSDDLWNS